MSCRTRVNSYQEQRLMNLDLPLRRRTVGADPSMRAPDGFSRRLAERIAKLDGTVEGVANSVRNDLGKPTP